MQYDLVIIGAGMAGLLALGFVPTTWTICVIDPSFSGGDLGTKWGAIMSNTTAKQICDALVRVPGFAPLCKLSIGNYKDTENVPLHEVAENVQLAAAPAIARVECMLDMVAGIKRCDDKWCITFRHKHDPITTAKVFLCTGGEPRSMDIARPTLPLEVAFDKGRLTRKVSTGDVVAIFGAAHSGVLVARNLHDLGARVFLIHSGKRPTSAPFLYARNGDYEGVKSDAAEVCDKILAGEYPRIKLISYTDTAAVANASIRARFVVYAIGFQPRSGINIENNGTFGIGCEYDPDTAEIKNAPNMWGFGMCYPSKTEYKDVIYYDVGIPAFVAHIEKCIPKIIA